MALEMDDIEPRPKKAAPRDLETLSLEELNAYIGELQAEIDRVRGVIARKQSHRTGAEAFFRRS
jgi:uncharacterized small protein (DUF1192 family)